MSVGRHPDVNGNLTLSVPGPYSGGESFRDPQRHFDYGGLYTPPGTPPLLGGTEAHAGELSTLVTLESVGMDVEIAFYYNSHSRETTWAGYKRTCNLFLSATACGTRISSGPLEGALPYVTLRRGNGARSVYQLSIDAEDNAIFTPVDNCGWNRLSYDIGNELWIEHTPDGRQTAYAAKWDGSSSPVLAVRDAVGNRHTFHYDDNGRLVALEDALSRFVEFTYDTVGQCDVLQSLTDWADRTTTFEYDGQTLPCKPLLRFVRTAVMGTNQVAQTEYEHDDRGSVTTVTDAEGFATVYELQGNGKVSGRRVFNLDGSYRDTLYRYGAEEVEGQQYCSIQVEDATGALTTSFQDERGRVAKVRTRLGQRLRFSHNGRGHETSRVDPAGKVWHTFYDGYGFPTGTRDGQNRQTSLEYDQYRNLRFIHEMWPGGGTTEMVWANALSNEDGRKRLLQQQIDATGRESHYLYNARGQLTSMADAVSQVFYEIDDQTGFEVATHRPVSDAENGGIILTTRSDRDSVGNLLALTDEEQKVWTYEYDQGDRLVKSFTPGHPDGNAVRRTYDLLGNLRSETDALQQVTLYEDYNAYDQVGKVQDVARSGATYSYYDGIGRLTTQQDPENHTSYVHYDQQTIEGLPTASLRTLRDGFQTKTYSDLGYGYGVCFEDGRGFLSNTIYDLAGHARVVVDERAKETVITPDGIGRPLYIKNALQHTTQIHYDLTDPEGNPQITVIDALTRSTRSVADKAGRSLYSVNEFGHVTRNILDDAGRLTGVLDAKLGTTRVHLDELGRTVGVTDARQFAMGNQGKSTRFAYDRRSLTTKITDQRDKATSLFYTDAGDLQYRDVPVLSNPALGDQSPVTWRRTTFTPDLLGRTRGVSYGNRFGQTPLGFDFDPLGRLYKVRDATGETTYGYDNNDLLTSVVAHGAGALAHTLDAEGNRLQMTGSNPQDGTSYSYDEAGNLLSITVNGEVTRFGYDDLGRENYKKLPNGIEVHRTWDAGGRPRILSYTISREVVGAPTPTTVQQVLAVYEMVHSQYLDSQSGQMCLRQTVNETDETGAQSTLTFDFDPLFQLVREQRTGSGPNYSITYDYDPAGNRISKNEDGAVTTYNYNAANQLQDQATTPSGSGQGGSGQSGGVSTTSYAYDLQGNCTRVTKDGVVTDLHWDEENQLTHVENASNSEGQVNVYGADGLRRLKDTGDGGETLLWDGNNLLNEGGNRYVDAPGEWGSLSAVHQENGTNRYFVFDWQGNTRRLFDENGNVTDSYVYSAFGQSKHRSGTTLNPYQFGGQWGYYTDKSNRVYVRARHLDVDAGRWLSPDPLGFDGGDTNLYAYCGNDPARAVDPAGTKPRNNSPIDILGPITFPTRIATGVITRLAKRFGRVPKGPVYQPQGSTWGWVANTKAAISGGTLAERKRVANMVARLMNTKHAKSHGWRDVNVDIYIGHWGGSIVTQNGGSYQKPSLFSRRNEIYLDLDDDGIPLYTKSGRGDLLLPTPLIIVLGHEMGHGIDQLSDVQRFPKGRKVGGPDMANVDLTENRLRAEFGLPPRTRYGIPLSALKLFKRLPSGKWISPRK